MYPLRRIARILTPCCLLAACASVPEVPAVTVMHPAHPDAQAARIGDRPSILDAMAMDVAPQTEAMGAGEMDHSHHDMMDEGKEDPSEEPDDGEGDGPPGHGGDDGR